MSSSQENSKQTGGLVNGNGGSAASLLQDGHLSSELRNLVSILGSQSGSGISLEQLLSASNSTGQLPPQSKTTPTSTIPTTPSNSTGDGLAGRKRGLSYGSEEMPKRRRSNNYTSRQSGDRQANKGLRHFSQRVCEKVRAKGTTTYNEVADELVKELSESEKKSQVPIDQKNIRRRVYDALNVLMAMNIISKEKKEIKWIGLPTNSAQECQHIEEELTQTQQRIQTKRSEVESLLVQILSFKNLMKRNRDRVASLGAPAQNAAIGLPFIIVNTSKKTTIDCSISSDKSEYIFNFDNAFELHNDVDVLKKMGLDCGLHSGTFTQEDIKNAKSMLPKAFGDTLDDIAFAKAFPNLSQTPTLIATPGGSVHASPSLTSTPTAANLSPLLTPLSVPAVQGSPVPNSQIAAALASVKQVTSSGQNSPRTIAVKQGSSPAAGLGSPVRSSSAALQTKVAAGNASPSSLTSRLYIRPTKSPSTKLKQSSPSNSPMSAAKSALHTHCPSQVQMSPLVKSSVPSVASSSTAPGSSSPSSATSKSPAPKIVTVSKLPTAEQLTSILQQLQQNGALSKLLSSASSSNGTDRQVTNGGLPSMETEAPLESSESQLPDQGGLTNEHES